jgi:uncharacterized protein
MTAPLLLGFCFGWLLERAGLTRYDRIVGVYRFTDLAVLKFLGSGLAAGAVALQIALWLGLASAAPLPATILVANLAGGGLFGVGMAIGGFCPGTIVAGAGAGQLDYLIPGVAGLLAGALVASRLSEPVIALQRMRKLGAIDLPALLGASGGLVAILLLEIALIGFYALERGVRPPARSHVLPSLPLRKAS